MGWRPTTCRFAAPGGGARAAEPFLQSRPSSALEAARLTVREVEILSLLAKGLSNRQIAERLVLSPRTVERHLENLYRKIGTHNRAEATAYAFTNGLADTSA